MQKRVVIILILLAVLLTPLAGSHQAQAAPTVVAFDMFSSASQNLVSYTNPWRDAFGSPGDGFQKYQRGVSSSIPFSVLDDSLFDFPADELGIIDEANLEEFFGIVDTENSDNSGPVSAEWVFNIAGASDMALSIDMGAMGDFESSDFFLWEYQVDGGPVQTAFQSSVDEAGSQTYTLAGGTMVTLSDPMLANGILLSNVLQTLSVNILGTGSQLTLTLTAQFDGGSEAVAFQNILLEGDSDASAPISATCDGPLDLIEGFGGSREVSASDEDGIVTSITLVDVSPPSSDISLTNVTPASEVGGSATAMVEVASTISPGIYTVTIGFANNDAVPQTAQCSFPVQVIQFVPIYDIQGNDRYSPFQGQDVATSGVLTLTTANGRDAWIQDPGGDGDPTTSDGIFIDDFNTLTPQPEIGDLIVVWGEVEEQQFGNALPLTRIDDTILVEIVSSGNLLPEPVNLSDLPNEVLQEGELFWEPLEGMLVSVENAPVTSATNGFGEFGMLAKEDAKPGSGFFADTQHILVQNLGGEVVDYNPERIMVDDSSLDEAIFVQPGDRVRSLVGVVDYTFSMYKLQPVSFDVFTHNLPTLPVSTRSGGFGNATITTFNVENLFDLVLNTPEVVDSLGRVGEDPGSGWGPPPTNNNTLVRSPDICQGDMDPTDPFDPALEWIGLGNNVFSDLGTHVVNCGNTSGLLISESIEGSSFNKALEIYNGTGSPVNLGAANVNVQIFFNGNTSPGQTIQLSGTLADGEVFVLAHPDADPAILAVADQISGGVLFNGDDAITLNFGGKDDASSTPDPDELETQLAKLAKAIEIELQLPEIIVVQEIENQAIAQELADRVNLAAGTSYVATSFETSDGRGIEPGFLWDANRVGLLDAYQMSGPGVEQWFGPSSPSAGREPIVGVFDIHGFEVTIIGNHFKSKGGDDPLYGVNWPPVRVTEVQRKGQAQVVRDFVNQLLAEDPAALVMVAGDLNDFQFSEPGEGPDNPVAILEGFGDEVPLTNLLNFEKPSETWTYVFDGNAQVLDHMLVSPALLAFFQGADVLHFNTNTPTLLLEDNAASPLSASDHDPLEGRFLLK